MAQLHDIEIDDYLADCVKIEPLAVEEEYIRLPADLAYWNARRARALRAHLLQQIETKRFRARLRIEKREELTLANGKATESMVEAAVDLDQGYNDAQVAEVETEVEHERLKGAVDAVRTKKEMLVSLGADMRVEKQGDPKILEQARARRAFTDANR